MLWCSGTYTHTANLLQSVTVKEFRKSVKAFRRGTGKNKGHRPSVAFGGLRQPSVAFGILRWPSVSTAGLQDLQMHLWSSNRRWTTNLTSIESISNETGCHIACEESLSNRIWQIFLIGTVHYAEGLRRMRRHGPAIVHCTDLEDFPRIHIVDHLYAPTEELTECSLLSTDMNYNSHSSYMCLQWQSWVPSSCSLCLFRSWTTTWQRMCNRNCL